VVFGVRDPDSEKMRSFLNSIPGEARGRLDRRAANHGEVLVIANSWNATQEAISACGDLTDKVVIDTNPIGKMV